ncbi:heat shock protein beta-9 [Electrophorus electricus]|uniref:SHSP domain-containing protein n=1 Tax=Electrophorus electricus TaxID=8005 RepID=A0A4W4EKB3_ELEEL|nr:heat shock protein beta-9 [Electrophorus electricus]
MSQSAIESLFGEDPFFEDATYLLWPRSSSALDSFREHFLHRRAQLLENFRTDVRDSLTRELCEGFPGSLLRGLDGLCPLSLSSVTGPSTERTCDRAVAVTLDTQGFSPEDITVTVSGRRLEVMAARSAEMDSCSSTDAKPAGFIQSVELPEHIDPAQLTCTQGEDGLLCIQLETKQSPSEERLIPIRFRTSLDFPLTKDNTQNGGEQHLE